MLKLSIRTKLMGAFAFVTILEIALSVFALSQLSAINDQVRVMRVQRIPAVESVLNIEKQIGTYRRRQFIDLLSPAADLKAAEGDIADTSAAIDQALVDYQPLVVDATDQANLSTMTKVWNAYRDQSTGTIQLARDGKAAEGYQLLNFGPVNDAWDAVGAASTTWETAILAESDTTSAAATGIFDKALVLILALLGVAVVAGFAVGFFISQRIRRDVHAVRFALTTLADETATDLADAMAALASNDLTAGVRPTVAPIEHYGSDEVGDMAAATNVLVARLAEATESYESAREQLSSTIGEVRSAAAAVAATSSVLNQAAAESGGARRRSRGPSSRSPPEPPTRPAPHPRRRQRPPTHDRHRPGPCQRVRNQPPSRAGRRRRRGHGAGRRPGREGQPGDGSVHNASHRRREPRSAVRQRCRRRHGSHPGGRRSDRGQGHRARRQVRPDRRDRRDDRRHRRADQPAGAQRRDRGGPGRRAGQGLCRRRRRGPQAGRTVQPRHQGNRGADRPGPDRDRAGGRGDADRRLRSLCRKPPRRRGRPPRCARSATPRRHAMSSSVGVFEALKDIRDASSACRHGLGRDRLDRAQTNEAAGKMTSSAATVAKLGGVDRRRLRGELGRLR